MKKLLLILLAFTTVYATNAQVQTPAPSPASKLEQKVGLTDVTIEYSRPSVKGRAVFGDLVPFDKLWRTGANKNSIITFSTDATVDGQTLKAGSYAIFTKPGKESWEVYFYSDTENWGTPSNWDDSKVAAKTTVKTHSVPFIVETFTLDVNSITNNGGTLDFIWENTYVGVPFTLPTSDIVQASIDKALSGPAASDYYSAAVYYSQEGKNLEQAKEYMEKAMGMIEKPGFWQLRQQSLIYAKLGDKKAAIATAKKSLAGAEEAGNADYVKMNKDSLKEWGAM
ncbi:DUF2911 domain-containing protein [Flavisericum labens]|uniref:DUF2911 domain-containing protein n=1 Tax=Flavisericum labens TaxID=3377112 RepID=UPI00387AE323